MASSIFDQKNCLLTGATGGIGNHLAFEMAKRNCNLFLTGTSIQKLRSLKLNLKSSFPKITVYIFSANLNKFSDISKLSKNVQKKFKKIDILINCAGVFRVQPATKNSLNDFDTCFNVNVKAPFFLSQMVIPKMKQQKWGRIINIGSSSSYIGFENTTLYTASKHALLGFSRSLDAEIRKFNIRVFCFSPGSVKTKMGKQVKKENYSTFIEPKELAEFIISTAEKDSEFFIPEIFFKRFN